MQRTTKGLLALLLLFMLLCVGIPYLPELGFLVLSPQARQLIPAPSTACGDSRCAALFPRAYPVPITPEGQQQGISERWCVTYTSVRPHTGRTGVYWRWAYPNGRAVAQVVERKAGVWYGSGDAHKGLLDPRFATYCG